MAIALTCSCATIDRGNFGPFQRSLNTKSHGYDVLEDPTGSAPTEWVERFEVRPGDCSRNEDWSDCANDRERSELSERNKITSPGREYWYGWHIYFPEDYPNIFPTKVALGQFHQVKEHAIWMFQNSRGGYHLDDQVFGRTHRYHKLIDEKDLRGQWHQIEVHVKWSTSSDGFMRVWVNGEKKVDHSGQTMTASATYFKYGVYRSFMRRYESSNPGKEAPAQTVLYANVKRGKTRESLQPE